MNTQTKPDDSAATRYRETSIELDCPPGGIRPSNLIAGVLKGTGFEVSDFDTSAPFFGHQTWVLKASRSHMSAKFKEAKPTFKERVTALYNEGFIRYGTW